MTIKQTLYVIKANSPSISVKFVSETQEYRITIKYRAADRREDAAYYTSDSADAINTARSMQVFVDENIGRNSL